VQIFVLGATGVIGLRMIPLLLQRGHHISAYGRLISKRAALEESGATKVALELFDADDSRRAVAGHEVIINLATAIPLSTELFLPGT
jgi:uncharacterized protein YbjT (DUF2867 family)